MSRLFAGAVVAATIAATPALSGKLSDPVLEQDLIIAEAENDTAQIDTLLVALTLALVMVSLGN